MRISDSETVPEKIVVLGNNSAAWMSCAFLAKHFNKTNTTISLITNNEPDCHRFPVSVLPEFGGFLDYLNIDERQFMGGTSATFKLADVFSGWPRANHYFFHTHGEYGIAKNYIGFHHLYLRLTQDMANSRLESTYAYHDYSLAAQAAMHDLFTHPNNDPNSIYSTLEYSWHFNEDQFVDLLKTFCSRNATHKVVGNVQDVILNSDSNRGDIIHSVVVDNQTIQADLFVDCSTQRTITRHLESCRNLPIYDWDHIIQTNQLVRTLADGNVRSRACDAIVAHSNGIEFIQPTQGKTGLSFYSHTLGSQDQNTFIPQHFLGPDSRTTQEKNYSVPNSWIGNCIALGPAAANINSPVISSVDITWLGLKQLIKHTPYARPCPILAAEFNIRMSETYTRIKDYVVLLRELAKEPKGNFWQHQKARNSNRSSV